MGLPIPEKITIAEFVESLWPRDVDGNKIPESQLNDKDKNNFEFFKTLWDINDPLPTTGLQNQIYLDPSFQSPFRWSLKDCILYYDSIHDGHAASAIHLADVYKCMKIAEANCPNDQGSTEWMETLRYFRKLHKLGFRYVIIDGNNRNITVLLLRLGLIKLPKGNYKNVFQAGKYWTYSKDTAWDDLETSHKVHLLNMNLNVLIHESTSRREMSVYFNRINHNSSLNDQELRQSWFAEIADFVRKYAKNNLEMFDVMSKNNFDRFRRDHEEMLAVVAVLFNSEIFKVGVKKSHLDHAYGQNEKETTNEGNIWYGTVVPFLDNLKKVFNCMPKGDFTKAWFVDIVNFMRQHSEMVIIDYEAFAERLLAAYKSARNYSKPIHTDKNGSEKTFKELSRGGWSDAELMKLRGLNFLEAFYEFRVDDCDDDDKKYPCLDGQEKSIDQIMRPKSSNDNIIIEDDGIERDPKRLYNFDDKYQLWLKQKKRTTDGKHPIPLSEIFDSTKWQANHIIEWDLGVAKGGVTTIPNGELISVSEHAEKTSNYMAKKRAKASEKTLAQAA